MTPELKQRLAAAEAEIAYVKAMVEQESKPWPQEGDKYWIVSNDLGTMAFEFNNHDYDKLRQSIGNMFRTEAEAKAELEARKVIAELRACEGWKPFKVGKNNFGIAINFLRGSVTIGGYWPNSDGGWQSIYFKDEASTQAAILKVGEQRILKAARWLAMREV